MLALKTFRSRAAGLPDLLNWAALIGDGIVQGKDGSLLAGWFYRGPDIASSTDDERNWLTGRINAALARLGSGWVTWVEAVRLPASGYPAAELSHFPDPVSRLIDEERRRQFLRERLHYESEYALLVQYTPPLRRKHFLNFTQQHFHFRQRRLDQFRGNVALIGEIDAGFNQRGCLDDLAAPVARFVSKQSSQLT